MSRWATSWHDPDPQPEREAMRAAIHADWRRQATAEEARRRALVARENGGFGGRPRLEASDRRRRFPAHIVTVAPRQAVRP